MIHRIRDHVELFNIAQRSGDWAPFVATFAGDAVMSFVGVPAGPYEGTEAIAQAYATRPPTDTMDPLSAESDGDTDVVRFAWTAGGTGTMTIRWRDGQVASLRIVFD